MEMEGRASSESKADFVGSGLAPRRACLSSLGYWEAWGLCEPVWNHFDGDASIRIQPQKQFHELRGWTPSPCPGASRGPSQHGPMCLGQGAPGVC